MRFGQQAVLLGGVDGPADGVGSGIYGSGRLAHTHLLVQQHCEGFQDARDGGENVRVRVARSGPYGLGDLPAGLALRRRGFGCRRRLNRNLGADLVEPVPRRHLRAR